MKYSYAFEKLYMMTLDTNLRTETKYKRVAHYLSRIMMAEHRPELDSIAWDDDLTLDEIKDLALQHLVEITDVEWKMIQGAMRGYASRSAGTDKWRAMRMEWVRALDTLRAFS